MESFVLAAGVLLWSGSAGSPCFLALRNAKHATWGFAKGHLEPGEDLLTGALRECREETGLRLNAADLAPGFADVCHYLTPGGKSKRVVMFLAANACAAVRVARSREHDAEAWWTADEAVSRFVHEELRRSVVRAAHFLRESAARRQAGSGAGT